MMKIFSKYSALSDEDLVTNYKTTGDSSFIGLIYERYSHLVINICFKYLKNEDDSKDAAMDIFQDMMETLKTHHISNFKSWLYTVCRNHCLMKIRKQDIKTVELEEKHENENFFMEKDAFVHLTNEDAPITENDINDALEHLESKQKQCIEMFYLNEKTYQEITELTGYNLQQVKS